MSETKAKIQTLTRDSLEDLFRILQEGDSPLPYPTALKCLDVDPEDLLEYEVVWKGVSPLRLAMMLAEVFHGGKFPEEIDPHVQIVDKDGFASKYLFNNIELRRLKETVEHQKKRINTFAVGLLDAKQTIKDTNDLVGDMYLQHTVALRAVMHMNQQLTALGAEPFDFSSIQINKH